LEIVERAERRPQSWLLRTEEDLCVVAGEITDQLGELDFGMEDGEDHPKSDRLKLDYARLLANAVRDRIDPEPWARIQALIGALEGLQITFSQSRFHERVVLLEAIQTLGRIYRSNDFIDCVREGGLAVKEQHDHLGACHTMLVCGRTMNAGVSAQRGRDQQLRAAVVSRGQADLNKPEAPTQRAARWLLPSAFASKCRHRRKMMMPQCFVR
jgi:hypothetical protein